MTELFQDIGPMMERISPPFYERHWFWIAAAALAAFIAVGIFLVRKKAPKPISPREIALMRLEAAGGLEEAKRYAAAVSSALRDYIEAVHGLPAPERTTGEFMALASAHKAFESAQRESLAKILELSDMAKFAKAQFGDGQRQELMTSAKNFIENDLPPQAEPEK